MLYNIEGCSFDTEKVNYTAVWDSLGLSRAERQVADRIIGAYNKSNPDLKGADHYKTLSELQKAVGKTFGAVKAGDKKDRLGISLERLVEINKAAVIEKLIEAGVLERHEKMMEGRKHAVPAYGLDPKEIARLEKRRKFSTR